MKILIYDDNKKDIIILSECINNFFQRKNITYSITICNSKNDLLKDGFSYDIIFLDVEIDNENGIKLGLQLRELACQSRIIIVSQFSKYLIEGYKIHADRYFIKPITQDVFDTEMENVISNYFKQHVGFIDKEISLTKIYLKDILYVEYLDRKSILYFTNGKSVSSNYPLKHWLDKLLNYSFGQSHKSFVVNFMHIKEFYTNDLLMINNQLVPLSRHYKKEFEMKYIESLHKVL